MYYIATKNDTDYLIHHGIKGQKWGVRRYQNEDGSLKPAGEKRYGDISKGSSKKYASDVRKALNKNDKSIAEDKNSKWYIDDSLTRLNRKKDKLIKKGKEDKAQKYDETISKLKNKSDEYAKSINDKTEQAKKLVSTALKNGYDVSAKDVIRTPSVERGKIVAGSVLAVVMNTPTYTFYNTVAGTKYKVKSGGTGKMTDKRSGHFNAHTTM